MILLKPQRPQGGRFGRPIFVGMTCYRFTCNRCRLCRSRTGRPLSLRGQQKGQTLLENGRHLGNTAEHALNQVIETDSPESLLSQLSEKAELTVLGQDRWASQRAHAWGPTASMVAGVSPRPMVAVPAAGRHQSWPAGRPATPTLSWRPSFWSARLLVGRPASSHGGLGVG
jgi:hypothetical protein